MKRQKSSDLQEKMRERLKGSRFRWLNEKLYTQNSFESFSLIKHNSALFHEYHEGFNSQVKLWPVRPLDIIIKKIEGFIGEGKLNKHPVIICDMGCGEARLAKHLNAFPCKVYSFDFFACNEAVTACDIAHVPLKDEEADVVVFCLSLMGTNYMDFIKEGIRTLAQNGIVFIAEVSSRFGNLTHFCTDCKKLGLKITNKDTTNSHFVILEGIKVDDKKLLVKAKTQSSKDAKTKKRHNKDALKPCLYKKR